MLIRPAADGDRNPILERHRAIIRRVKRIRFHATWTRRAAIEYWLCEAHEVFVAEENGDIVGTYFLQANQQGGGGHVANCGYITAVTATGRGVARAMCEHSLGRARDRRFRAMQFNFVVSTNERAVRLWQSFGFEIVGTLPKAFLHPILGYVDAYVMYRDL